MAFIWWIVVFSPLALLLIEMNRWMEPPKLNWPSQRLSDTRFVSLSRFVLFICRRSINLFPMFSYEPSTLLSERYSIRVQSKWSLASLLDFTCGLFLCSAFFRSFLSFLCCLGCLSWECALLPSITKLIKDWQIYKLSLFKHFVIKNFQSLQKIECVSFFQLELQAITFISHTINSDFND